MSEKNISQAVIGRLPRYYRYLGNLMAENVERISSTELAEIMKVTASQIRQDFNTFGGFGQQGYGYNVKYLRSEMGKILGLDHDQTMIVVGAGNLAHALTNYNGFSRIAFSIIGLFDNNPELFGKDFNGISIMPIAELGNFIQEHHVDVGVLAVSRDSAKEAAQAMVNAGIKNIWNFVPVDLDIVAPEDVIIQNEHLADSLIQLSYRIKAASQERDK